MDRDDIVPPRFRHRIRVAAAVVLSVVLAACFTGERPRLAEGAGTTGDADVDGVLERLAAAVPATFTADYTLTNKFGSITKPATVVQDGASRRSVTIGDIRFLVEGASTATCDLDAGTCTGTIDTQRVSDLQGTTPDFYSVSSSARLRRDAAARIGPTVASTATIGGQPATCVDIPVTGYTSSYCALDAGPLARYDGPDVTIELTGFSVDLDEVRFGRTGGS